MLKRSLQYRHLLQLATMLFTLALDALRFLGLCVCPSPRLAAENLFLRKQLTLYQERHGRPRRTTDVTRIAMIWFGRWFDWRQVTALGQRERAAMPLFLAPASPHPPWRVGCAGGVDRVAERGARETTTGG
jgi:hypothetical protein